MVISTEQFVSKVKGRLPNTFGKAKESKMYCGGTIYVDHASTFMFVQSQVSLNADEAIQGNHQFERDAHSNGIDICSYRSDNGIYKLSEEFQKDLLIRNQLHDLSGVGAHHQHVAAERDIRTVSENARAMMLHAAIHWPNGMSLDLWPFAVEYAVYIWNRMPNQDSGVAPIEFFYGCKLDD